MAIQGKFEVTPIGAASYSIPIQVSPGVSGMQPSLTLSYNSRGGNGLLGVGWTLAGLPSISRCPRTTPQDGVKGAVAYDANDRFCLDGQRLMVVSGTYGAAGSSYRTEIESFSNVTAMGSAGSSPQYFVVKTKDGRTMEFGNTTDSRIVVAGLSTVRVWALNKISDTVGNTQSVVYSLPSAISASTTEYNTYPQRIDYTSNSITGLAATNSVEFAYATRPDPISSYRGGYPFKTSVRLTSLTTKTDGAIVSTYTPTYAAGSGGRSTITSISWCAASGLLCAPVTSFGIGSVGGSLFPLPGTSILPVTTTESSVSGGKWISMDVNGDGLTDLVHLTALSGIYRVWVSKGDGTFTISESSTAIDTSLSTGSWQVLDIDGDGQADLVHLTTTPGLVQVWKSDGTGKFTITSFSNSDKDTSLGNGSWLTLDVNGDGLADLVHMTSNTGDMRVWKSNGDGTFAISQFINSTDTDLTQFDWKALDVNGDGLADLVHLSYRPTADPAVTSAKRYVWKSKGNGTFDITAETFDTRAIWIESTTLAKLTSVYKLLPVDLNNDGLVDLVMLHTVVNNDKPNDSNLASQNSIDVLLSKGDGTFAKTTIPPSQYSQLPLINGAWQIVDVDGDGLGDLVHTPANLAAGWYGLWRSNGDGTFAVSVPGQQVDTCSSNCTTMEPGDFLGIGAPGFVRVDGNTVKSAWLLSQQPSNIAISVSNGAGGTTSWDLSPLPGMLRRGNYLKDIPSDNVAWTLSAAVPVVETVRTNPGWVHGSSQANADRATFFTYGSARVERNGRGFLGFKWLQSKDAVTGLSTRTYFRQDFPFTGLVSTKGNGSGSAWNNLSLSTTAYECNLLDGGSTCPVAAGNRYFVYPSQIDTQSWDLDGTALPRSRVVNSSPDVYGNIRSTASYRLNADGSSTDYSKTVNNTYYNDPSRWYLGRLVKSVVTVSGPSVAAPVIPGSGGLPAAVAPSLPPQTLAAITTILQLLLSDD